MNYAPAPQFFTLYFFLSHHGAYEPIVVQKQRTGQSYPCAMSGRGKGGKGPGKGAQTYIGRLRIGQFQ